MIRRPKNKSLNETKIRRYSIIHTIDCFGRIPAIKGHGQWAIWGLHERRTTNRHLHCRHPDRRPQVVQLQEVTVLSKCSSLFPPQIQNPMKSMHMMQGYDCFSIALVFQWALWEFAKATLTTIAIEEKNKRKKIKQSSHVLPLPPLPRKDCISTLQCRIFCEHGPTLLASRVEDFHLESGLSHLANSIPGNSCPNEMVRCKMMQDKHLGNEINKKKSWHCIVNLERE